MVGFFVPAGFEPVTLTTQSGLTTHSVTDCPTPRGRELEKVKFPKFTGATDGSAAEAWLANMAMCFALRDYNSNMEVHMVVFQLKGITLLWWKMLLPQLNMVVEDVSWELFEERFWERYLSEELIEHQLNEFKALRQGGHTVSEYEARFMELLQYAPHLNTDKLKVNKFVFGLNFNICAKVRILMPQTLHDAFQKALIAKEERGPCINNNITHNNSILGQPGRPTTLLRYVGHDYMRHITSAICIFFFL
jgi:hypothetical protein